MCWELIFSEDAKEREGPKLGAKLKKDLSLQFPPAHKAQMTS